jgi:hypothetical protein
MDKKIQLLQPAVQRHSGLGLKLFVNIKEDSDWQAGSYFLYAD